MTYWTVSNRQLKRGDDTVSPRNVQHGNVASDGFEPMIEGMSWFEPFTLWLRSPLGGLVFIPLYAVWVTLLLPGVWASMLAGAIYGTWWGSLIVFVGACFGAEAAFLLGRYWLRDWTSKRLTQYKKLQAVERAVSREGLKLVLLTRLSPAFPFSLLNLVYGLSEVSLRDYSIGLIGIIPGTILFCALGALAGDAARFGEVLAGEASAQAWILRVVGVLATVAVVWLVGRAARKALADGAVDL
jgi:uncharacterized membrane protein YdjX (TVP38/TMEM64 family)